MAKSHKLRHTISCTKKKSTVSTSEPKHQNHQIHRVNPSETPPIHWSTRGNAIDFNASRHLLWEIVNSQIPVFPPSPKQDGEKRTAAYIIPGKMAEITKKKTRFGSESMSYHHHGGDRPEPHEWLEHWILEMVYIMWKGNVTTTSSCFVFFFFFVFGFFGTWICRALMVRCRQIDNGKFQNPAFLPRTPQGLAALLS